MLTTDQLDPIQRRELLTFLISRNGGQLLRQIAEGRLEALIRDAGTLAIDVVSDNARRESAIQECRDEAGHIRYLLGSLDHLATSLTPTAG